MKDGNIVFRSPTKARDSSVNQIEKSSRIRPVFYVTTDGADSPEVKTGAWDWPLNCI